jgi:hypothetical protein
LKRLGLNEDALESLGAATFLVVAARWWAWLARMEIVASCDRDRSRAGPGLWPVTLFRKSIFRSLLHEMCSLYSIVVPSLLPYLFFRRGAGVPLRSNASLLGSMNRHRDLFGGRLREVTNQALTGRKNEDGGGPDDQYGRQFDNNNDGVDTMKA